MLGFRLTIAGLALTIPAVFSGCLLAPKGQVNALNAKNEALSEQTRAQAARIKNLQAHSRNVENQLIRAEEDLAMATDQVGLSFRRLHDNRFEGDRQGSSRGGAASGVSKFQTDVLFESGSSEVDSKAEATLSRLVEWLNARGRREWKLLIVGHADDPPSAPATRGPEPGEAFHLSAQRAIAVRESLERLGLAPKRMGVAGFGPHQPIARNAGEKNRRVELFVMSPEVPVIGWTETIPWLY